MDNAFFLYFSFLNMNFYFVTLLIMIFSFFVLGKYVELYVTCHFHDILKWKLPVKW
jgi:hypothetical protein